MSDKWELWLPGNPVPLDGIVQLSCGHFTCMWTSSVFELDEHDTNAAWTARNKAMHEYQIHLHSHNPEPNTFFRSTKWTRPKSS